MHIIATIGPKSLDKIILKDIINKGVDIIRLNCSHFDEEIFNEVVVNAREIKKDIHIMIDLCGKKIRVSDIFNKVYKVENGENIYFCGEDFYNAIKVDSINKTKLIPLNINSNLIKTNEIKAISIKDNTIRFKVLDKKQGIIKTIVTKSGIIRSGKGCNISTIKYTNNNISEKDKKNVKWALEKNINIICQSYVENKNDINQIKHYTSEYCNNNVEVWGKVETPIGINNLENIINSTNTIIIGRGDLVPEAGLYKAVELENKAIKYLKYNGKKVIVATNLLNSIKSNDEPLLSEVESIYTFIKNNVDGFLLASETSVGRHPSKTIEILRSIIKKYKSYV